MRKAGLVLLLAGALTTLAFLVAAGEPGRLSWWPAMLPFAAWALLPYAVAFLAARPLAPERFVNALLCVAAALLAATTATVLAAAFVWHPDPQSGLVFFILPFWQLGGLLPLLFLAHWRARRAAGHR